MGKKWMSGCPIVVKLSCPLPGGGPAAALLLLPQVHGSCRGRAGCLRYVFLLEIPRKVLSVHVQVFEGKKLMLL